MFEQTPPTGVRVETPDGIHYAQYSFWPSLRIINGFVQSLVGLYDVAQITGDPRAAQLFADGDATARKEVPTFDTGAWSFYSRGAITRESDLSYHTLLRDFLTNLCDRTAGARVLRRRGELHRVPDGAAGAAARARRACAAGRPTTLAFTLSKISRTSITVTAPNGKQVLAVSAGTVGRGKRTVSWNVPRKAGDYTVRIAATDLAGNEREHRGHGRGAEARSGAE